MCFCCTHLNKKKTAILLLYKKFMYLYRYQKNNKNKSKTNNLKYTRKFVTNKNTITVFLYINSNK